ncbi:MAG: methyltransferase domain-containing protein [Paracraurococcus sp.]
MFDRRSAAAEWMDDAAATEAAFTGALRDLARVNRLSLAYRPVLRWLDRLVAETGARHLSVLDVGAGGGDTLLRIAAWAERRGVAVTLTGLDRSPWAARHAAAAGVPADWITCDLFALDPDRRFDVVLCSLFAHHLLDPELVRFLRWLEARGTRGWLISDLHRHWLPWGFVWGAFRLLRLDPMVVHDGPVSIARAFTRADWQALLAAAGVEAEIAWVFPFRWSVGRRRA